MVKRKRDFTMLSKKERKGSIAADLSLLYKGLLQRKIEVESTEHSFLASTILCLAVHIINSTSILIFGIYSKGLSFCILDAISGTLQPLFYSIVSNILFSVLFSRFTSCTVHSMVLVLQSILLIVPLFLFLYSMCLFEPRLVFSLFLFVSVEKTMASFSFKTGKGIILFIRACAILLHVFIFKNIKETVFFEA